MSSHLSAGKMGMKSCSASESGLDSPFECRWLSVSCRSLHHADWDDSSWVSDPQVLTVAQTSPGKGFSEILRRHQAHLWFGTYQKSSYQWPCQSLCVVTARWTWVSFGEWYNWKARVEWRMYCINLFFSLSAETSFPVEVFPYNKKNPDHMEHMVNLQDAI